MPKFLAASLAAACTLGAGAAMAQVRITEVAAWGSSTSSPNVPYATDWFELTNIGSSAVNISGWKMDDNSNSFSSAVAMTGITTIAAGESVIFTENAATASFLSTWFGGSPPAGLQIGNYTGSSVGLSQKKIIAFLHSRGTVVNTVQGSAQWGKYVKGQQSGQNLKASAFVFQWQSGAKFVQVLSLQGKPSPNIISIKPNWTTGGV